MIQFGTDGWRAIISEKFTFANVRKVAGAIGDYVLDIEEEKKGLVVGYDTRFLSKEYAAEVAKVLSSKDIPVYLTEDAVPTPVVSFAIVARKAAGGVMITASHNPAIYNGIKFKAGYGGSASPQIMKMIERKLTMVKADNLPAKEEIITLIDPKQAYCDHLRLFVDLEKIKRADLKVIVDPMYGAGRNYLLDILQDCNLKVQQIRGEINPGFGGINPEPIKKNLGLLMDIVKTAQADIGLATDGDADRIGAVDAKGNFVDSHRIFTLLLEHFIVYKKWQGEVVKTFSVSQMIDKLAAKYQLKLHETPIGFKYICDLMQERDILIGGEESGGIGLKGHLPERDGILCSLLLLEIMAVQKKPLHVILEELMQEIGHHCYDRRDLPLSQEKKDGFLNILKHNLPEEIAGLKVKKVERLDGTKLFFNDGSWLLFRPSGTEPVVRIYAEAADEEAVQCLLEGGQKLID